MIYFSLDKLCFFGLDWPERWTGSVAGCSVQNLSAAGAGSGWSGVHWERRSEWPCWGGRWGRCSKGPRRAAWSADRSAAAATAGWADQRFADRSGWRSGWSSAAGQRPIAEGAFKVNVDHCNDLSAISLKSACHSGDGLQCLSNNLCDLVHHKQCIAPRTSRSSTEKKHNTHKEHTCIMCTKNSLQTAESWFSLSLPPSPDTHTWPTCTHTTHTHRVPVDSKSAEEFGPTLIPWMHLSSRSSASHAAILSTTLPCRPAATPSGLTPPATGPGPRRCQQ